MKRHNNFLLMGCIEASLLTSNLTQSGTHKYRTTKATNTRCIWLNLTIIQHLQNSQEAPVCIAAGIWGKVQLLSAHHESCCNVLFYDTRTSQCTSPHSGVVIWLHRVRNLTQELANQTLVCHRSSQPVPRSQTLSCIGYFHFFTL